MEFEKERKHMVEYQLRARGVKDDRVLKAMESVQRHLFIDEDIWDRAYDDCALPIGEGQTISQPYMVAVMTELLELKGEETVLEIGTGSGYQGALLSLLASDIFSVERIKVLALRAAVTFKKLNIKNIHLVVGDGTLALSKEAVYDGIIVTAAAPRIPDTYINQLKVNGRLVIPVGNRFSQVLYQVKKTPSGFITNTSTPCVFVPLIGKYGWEKSET
ncbi:MAG: protein-L-isoaspartate(D-aspartate) O-methyltransferase [Thermodesulfovibrionia bacterium]|nr:protein-L-isoaspartate(D-aspartate) O-methyltransferase [Thermodesulfovibrionia bacterium]